MTIHPAFIGCDISKDRIDCHILPEDRHFVIDNTDRAIGTFIADLADVFVVFEATSVCDRPLRAALDAAGIPFARVNPRKAREFARAAGYLAKTDKVDAAMLAHMGEALRPDATVEPSRERKQLKELLVRRRQLVDMRTAEKVRLKQIQAADLRKDIVSMIAILNRRIAKIELALKTLIRTTAELADLSRRLQTAPGIGPIIAACLIADMQELGTINRRTVAALAGLAPLASESGRITRKRRIWGGRKQIRDMLYLAAVTAARSNSPMRAFYTRMIDNGKAPKTALIALARKILVTLNAMIKTDRDYQKAPA